MTPALPQIGSTGVDGFREHESNSHATALSATYAAVLTLLVVCAFGISAYQAYHARAVASLIDEMGRQRMLSQKSVLYALENRHGVSEAASAARLLEESHRSLRQRYADAFPLSFVAVSSSPLTTTDLDSLIAQHRELVDGIAAGTITREAAVRYRDGQLPKLLALLDEAVTVASAEARRRIDWLTTLQIVLALSVLVAIGFFYLRVVRPRTQRNLRVHRTLLERVERTTQERNEALRNVPLIDAFYDSSIGIALVATDGRWLEVNHALSQMLGFAPEELKKTDFQSITHPDDLESDLTLVQEMLDGKRQTYNLQKRYFHKDGHVIHALLTVSLVRSDDERPEFFISQLQDLSVLLESQHTIQHQSDVISGLDTDVAHLVRAARHALKEPLRKIALYADMATRPDGVIERENALFRLQANVQKGQRALAVMERMGRVTGDFTRSQQDLQSIVVRTVEHWLIDNGTSCRIAMRGRNGHVDLDPGQIELALYELLDNALAHAQASPVEVRVAWTVRSQDDFAFSVRNRGAHLCPRRFTDMQQAFAAYTPEGPAMGMGLTIVRRVAANHKCRVGTDPRFSGGTRIVFASDKYETRRRNQSPHFAAQPTIRTTE